MCLRIRLEAIEAVRDRAISERTLRRLDEEQRKDLPSAFPADEPLTLVRRLPPAEEAAADEADRARWAIHGGVLARIKEGMPRQCARRCVLHLRKQLDPEEDGEEGFLDYVKEADCKSHTCPFCWRQRRIDTLLKAVGRILDDPEPDEHVVVYQAPGHPEKRKGFATKKEARAAREKFYALGLSARVVFVRGAYHPRLGDLHVGEFSWGEEGEEWHKADCAIRRRVGRAGRLRVRKRDDRVFVVCAQPFAGSRPVTAAEAAKLVAEAVDRLHFEKHAFRFQGEWEHSRAQTWQLVARLPMPADLEAAMGQAARDVGDAARRLPGGVVIRSRTLAESVYRGQLAEQAVLAISIASTEEEVSRNLSRPRKARARWFRQRGFPSDDDPGATRHG